MTAFEDEVGTSEVWSVQAYAVCADPLPELEIVEQTIGPASADFRRAAAFCPDGTFALGGGGRITGGQGQVHLYNAGAPSGNANNGSQAFGREDGGFDRDWSITAYAVCAAVDGTSVDTVPGTSITDSATSKSVTAQCRSGMRVTSGGAVVFTPGNTTGHPDVGPVAIVPDVLPGGVPGLNLTATGREHNPTTDTWRIVAHAYCAA